MLTKITEKLIKEMIDTADRISRRPGHWWADQLNNRDAVAGYYPLGQEIWEQTCGKHRTLDSRSDACLARP